MKKTAFLALVMLTCATVFAAGPKKKDKQQLPQQPAPVVLATSADSLSYASGVATTDGLMPYVQQQYQVDTAYMADFIAGFKEAVSKKNDPQYKARNAGQEIARMVELRILPQVKNDFEGTPDSINADLFLKGFLASIVSDTTVYNMKTAKTIFENRRMSDIAAKQLAIKQENAAWLAENAKKEGVKTLPDGLQYKVITEGKGEKPKASDKVVVKYEGKLIDGTVFDSSYKRNPQTSSFRCDQVIKGWTEALTMMPVGSKWELYIPESLGYGQRQAGQIKPYSTLIFTVELVSIEQPTPEVKTTVPAATLKPAKKVTIKRKK